MRIFLAFLSCTALLACGQTDVPAASPDAATTQQAAITSPPPWAICDGVNSPTLLLFGAVANGVSHVVQYEKPSGASVFTADVTLGQGDGAMGSVYTPLLLEGQDIGAVRELNAGVLATPGSAYTRVISSVNFRGTPIECRWLPRTRLMGFTGRRSIVISEDADGDLLYSSYNFTDAASSPPIELSDNGRSTRFSTEVRDGQENVTPQGTTFSFSAPDNFAYVVHIDAAGAGRIEVTQSGAAVQNEPLVAYVVGEGQTTPN